MRSIVFSACAGAALWMAAVSVTAQPLPDYGYQWATIGNVNNAAYDGPVEGLASPRPIGSVGYTYRIAKTEVATSHWLTFLNTFTTQPGSLPAAFNEFRTPIYWGGFRDGAYQGPGYRHVAGRPEWSEWHVGGISWRQAAIYCNWLHNGQSSDPASLLTGAYDISTWNPEATPRPYTDQERRLPGARFWIPSVDEWTKAAYYDPEKNGGAGGWWAYPTRSDAAPTSGEPGVGNSSVGYPPGWQIPVGSYPETQSAYGLLDLSGGAAEWTEDIWSRTQGPYRAFKGSSANDFSPSGVDRIDIIGSYSPYSGGDLGLRIASIPVPGSVSWLLLAAPLLARRRRSV